MTKKIQDISGKICDYFNKHLLTQSVWSVILTPNNKYPEVELTACFHTLRKSKTNLSSTLHRMKRVNRHYVMMVKMIMKGHCRCYVRNICPQQIYNRTCIPVALKVSPLPYCPSESLLLINRTVRTFISQVKHHPEPVHLGVRWQELTSLWANMGTYVFLQGLYLSKIENRCPKQQT